MLSWGGTACKRVTGTAGDNHSASLVSEPLKPLFSSALGFASIPSGLASGDGGGGERGLIALTD